MRKEINRYLDQPLVSSVSPFYIKCFFFLFFYFWLHWVFMVVQRLLSSCGKRGATLVVGQGLLLTYGDFSCCRAQALEHTGLSSRKCLGLVMVMQRFSCPSACGILPDQGLNPCPLYCKADSQPLDQPPGEPP